MAKYICKRIYDGDLNIVGYLVGAITSSNQKPSANHDILIGEEYRHAKAVEVDGVWTIIEDTTKAIDHEAKKQQKIDAKNRNKSIVWADITTVAKLKTVVKDLLLSME